MTLVGRRRQLLTRAQGEGYPHLTCCARATMAEGSKLVTAAAIVSAPTAQIDLSRLNPIDLVWATMTSTCLTKRTSSKHFLFEATPLRSCRIHLLCTTRQTDCPRRQVALECNSTLLVLHYCVCICAPHKLVDCLAHSCDDIAKDLD